MKPIERLPAGRQGLVQIFTLSSKMLNKTDAFGRGIDADGVPGFSNHLAFTLQLITYTLPPSPDTAGKQINTDFLSNEAK